MKEIKRSAKQEEKYNLILVTAEKLMKEKGIYALNMDELAKEANLAKGTLYIYFKSREEVIATLAFKARVLLLKEFEKETAKHLKPLDKLKAIITANFNFLKENSLYYDLVSFYEVNERETETPDMQLVIREISDLVIKILISGQAEESISRKIDPVIFSFTMWGMTVGLMQLLMSKATMIKSSGFLTEETIISNFLIIFEQGLINND